MRRIVVVLIFLFFFTGLRSAAALRFVYPEPEAKAWLAKAGPEAPFAPERFSTREAADRFFNKLYNAGALHVGVIIIKGDTAGLRIYLPLDKEKRRELFRLANEELERSGYQAEDDKEQETLEIWF